MSGLAAELAAAGIRLPGLEVGRTYRGRCPKCEGGRDKEKCLSVTLDQDDGAVWICHRGTCGWHGNVSGRSHAQVEYIKPRRRPAPIQSPEEADRRAVLSWLRAERGISEDTAAAFGVEAVRRNGELAIAFPYLVKGELTNIKYRLLAKKAFIQEADCERTLFNIDALADNDTAIFVEGELDVLALAEAGFPNAVTLPDGAPAKVKEEIDPTSKRYAGLENCADNIVHIEKWIIAGDNDAPGAAHVEELTRRLGKERCWLVTWPEGCKDANDTLKAHGAAALKAAIESARPHPIKSLFEADAFQSDVVRLFEGGKAQGLSTGWSCMDRNLMIRPGELSIVTGIPGSGKSEWIDALSVNLALTQGWRFAVCSFENPPDEHIAKLAEKLIGRPFYDGPTARMTRRELDNAMAWIARHFYFIRAEDEVPTFDWIMEKAVAAVRRYGINGLIVDPYNEIEHKRPPGMTETEYVSQILSRGKRFAQNHGVHFWFVAHPAKMRRDDSGNIPVPNLYDISGSSNWVNKADIGVVVSRDWEEGSRDVDVHLKKIRFKASGKVGIVKLKYDTVTGRYSNSDTDDEPNQPYWRSS